MNLHDSHYRDIRAIGEEPIIAMERAICEDLPPYLWKIARRNLCYALALKHEMRSGYKDDPAKEQTKAANYRHRARTGEWLK